MVYSLIILIFIMTGMTTSCKKSENSNPPSISLLSGNEYTPNGSVVKVGGKLTFGVTASGMDANITNFVIKKIMPDGSVKVVFDSGLNSTGFSVKQTFYQNVEEEAQWTFQVMDKNRQFATTSLTIYKDPNSAWGGILEFPLITMGYQNNITYGHYLSTSDGKVWFADSAVTRQPVIDLVTYFYIDDDLLNAPTLSSPGELGGGITMYYPEIGQWTTKNYTKYDISVDNEPIPATVFDACHNDSLLIVSYDEVWGKRKFKYAYPGVVVPFITAGGKKGLVKVITADNDPAGIISFSMKIQQ